MRTSTFDMYYDPRHFNPLQLQPRCAIEFCFQGLARWFAEYVTTFPAMIHDRRVGVVAIALDVDYLAPFSFFDGDRFTLTARCRVLRAGSMLETTTYIVSDDKPVAQSTMLCRCVALGDGSGLAALPGSFPSDMLNLFAPAERTAGNPKLDFHARLRSITARAVPLAEGVHHVTVYRHLCEVADQWCSSELPGYFGAGREDLIQRNGDEHPAITDGLRLPLRSVHIRIPRPLFLLDEASVKTVAYPCGDGVCFVHQVTTPGGASHAQGIEMLRYP